MQIQIQTTTALPNYSSALMKHSATNTSAQRNENKNLNYPSTNRLKCKVCSRAKCKKMQMISPPISHSHNIEYITTKIGIIFFSKQ